MGADLAAVGLGTGSAGAVSRDALAALRAAEAIYCPRSRNGEVSYARRRLSRIDELDAEVIEYPLAMQDGGESLRNDYARTADRIVDTVEAGRSAAAVTVGDPFLYSTLGPLLEVLDDRLSEDRIRTVPGINSVQAAAARLKRPLVQKDERFGVIPLTGDRPLQNSLFDQFDTLAFTKVNRSFDRLRNQLADHGRLGSSFCFERLGTDDERIRRFPELGSDYDPPYFALVLSFRETDPWN